MHARPQQFRHGFRAAERQQQTNFRIVQDRRLSRGVFLDAVCPEGRINRNGDRTGKEDSRVGDEKRARRRQHQCDAPARRDAAARQLRCTPLTRGIELAEGQREAAFLPIGIFRNQQVCAFGIMSRAIAQHIDERLCRENSCVCGFAVQLLNRQGSPQCGTGCHVFRVCSRNAQNRAR